ncbi:type II toxin-antitoxin system VapC family toxin [Ectothiorhodospiraceae bacterium WFHF3C12]|nr:type II toxin-antitoxin system VapC family toxin [Ectothiorhodospiraceae bacterium WFHF3C12]
MHRYLLDTNIVSELVRRPQGTVARTISRVSEDAVCTSIIVSAELHFGATKNGSTRLLNNLHAVLSALAVLPLESPADRYYAKLRDHLRRLGTPIGPNDMLIAAQALALDLTVVTANVAEFSRVPDLRVENWLAAGE